ncbi:MAG: 16S rRNA (uracil(1498)-N(3))-methyltransferase [Clostridia bacterium]|nr:16S rRNA (uracil(1498)-N(3))-methyltransferase [Clostridia bacterium]
MPRFFVSKEDFDFEKGKVVIVGEDARHISFSLRKAVGDRITVSNGVDAEYDCVLESFDGDRVVCGIESEKVLETEPPFIAKIYQALPKGDKLDTIIQKSTECGASDILPFESEFCIAKEKSDSAGRKLERRRRIAEEAAKQCGRGKIPEVHPTVDFKTAVREASKADIPIFCYEGEGTLPLSELLCSEIKKLGDKKLPEISVIIGSEGGFSPEEANFAKENGMLMAGLGRRILRCETVAGFVLACLVYELEL